MRKLRVGSPAYVGYVFLLLGFVSLGLFVVSLATGSGLAVGLGTALAVSLVAAVLGFRAQAARLPAGEHMSIWSEPTTGQQMQQYFDSYRGGQRPTSNVATLPQRIQVADNGHRLSA